MKIFLKRSTAFFVAVLIFCFSVVPVSAATLADYNAVYSSNYQYASQTLSIFDSLSLNASVNLSDIFFFRGNGGSNYIIGVSFSHLRKFDEDDEYFYYTNVTEDLTKVYPRLYINVSSVPSDLTVFDCSYINTPVSSISNKLHIDAYAVAFALSKKQPQRVFYFYCQPLSTYVSNKIETTFISKRSSSSYLVHGVSYTSNRIMYQEDGDANFFYRSPSSFIGPVQPDTPASSLKPSLYGIRLGIEKKGFVDWLKSEGKESVINSPGFSFTSNQLETLVDVYYSYGNNPFAFFSSLSKTFNITTDLKAASSLVQTIQQLYHDYLSYKNSVEIEEIKPSTDTHPHWRTDKEDVSLVTDQPDDTRDILILREILRTLIDMPYAVSVRFNYLQTGLTDILIDFQNLISVVDSLPDDLSNNISVGFDNSINTLVLPLTDINNSINSLVIPLTDINNSIRSLDFSSGGSGVLTEDLERLLLIPEDSHVFDDYNLMLQQHFYYNDLDSLPDLEDFIRLEQPVSLSSMDDEPLPDIYDSDLYYSAPVVELSNVSFDIDNYKVDFDDNEKFAVIDFSDDRWKTPVKFIRGIIGCLVLLWFCNWVVRFFPSLLSGYSSED